jgi:hypothetical protein
MRIGSDKKIQADLPEDPTWDNWRAYMNGRTAGKAEQIKISYGLEYR